MHNPLSIFFIMPNKTLLRLHKPKRKSTHRATSASFPPPFPHRLRLLESHHGDRFFFKSLMREYALNILSLLDTVAAGCSEGEIFVIVPPTQSLGCPRCGAERSAAICEPIEITTSQSTQVGWRFEGAEGNLWGLDEHALLAMPFTREDFGMI